MTPASGGRTMTPYELVKMARVALGDSQRNHHRQMLMLREKIPNFHAGANWQRCQSPSCAVAAPVWRKLKQEEDHLNPVKWRHFHGKRAV